MTKAITVYQARDGSRWDREKDAKARDAIILLVRRIMARLKPKPDTCDFSNGHGYVQQNEVDVIMVRGLLFQLAARGPLKTWRDEQVEKHAQEDMYLAHIVHPSWPHRMLDGSCAPLENAYQRLWCIDADFREWGQPYYASHQSEAPDQREIK